MASAQRSVAVSHSGIDFTASGEPATQESDPLEARNGELSINGRTPKKTE